MAASPPLETAVCSDGEDGTKAMERAKACHAVVLNVGENGLPQTGARWDIH